MARILIADDHPMIREALSTRLTNLGHTVVGEAANGHAAVALSQNTDCDLILMDISMPQMGGLAAAKQIRAHVPGLPILVVSTHDRADYVRAVQTLEIEGYLLKSAGLSEMRQAIDQILSGRPYFSPPVQRMLTNTDDEGEGALTQREEEILALVHQGLRSKEIAARLDISTRTVEAHRRNLNRKLDG